MYLNFFNFNKQPFHITPDPDFLYLSPSHKEALAAVIYGIEQRKGFVAITGAVGVGKTTILRSYLGKAERKGLRIIYLFNSGLSFEGLLKTIFQELGVVTECSDLMGMVSKLYEVLVEEYRQGNTVVLIVDEAQNMPVETLESLRMISNLETSKDKLIQIVLAGQPEFGEMLNLERLRQFKQRLAIRSTILPLTNGESLEYIKFRLRKACPDPSSVFTPQALQKIIRKARGIPRVLNILCDNALITACGYQKRPVNKKIAKEIIRDFEGSSRSWVSRKWVTGTVTAALIVVLLGVVWLVPGKRAMFNRISAAGTPQPTAYSNSPVRVPVSPDKPVQSELKPLPNVSAGLNVGLGPVQQRSKAAPVTKTVTRGDTLSGLVKDVYGLNGGGSETARRLDLVRLSNPQIKNADVIVPGQKITFPEPGKEPAESNQ
jgi:general secretion pathway protein A